MLLGGHEPMVSERAAEKLVDSSPSGTVMHHYPPFGFEESVSELSEIDRLIRAHEPDVVFVGLGFPKQEAFSQVLHSAHSSTWFIGCGGSIAMLAGEVSRAPRWVQALGAEWLYRLAQEPRRLFRRYIVHDIPYACGMLVRAALAGLFRSPDDHSVIDDATTSSASSSDEVSESVVHEAAFSPAEPARVSVVEIDGGGPEQQRSA